MYSSAKINSYNGLTADPASEAYILFRLEALYLNPSKNVG